MGNKVIIRAYPDELSGILTQLLAFRELLEGLDLEGNYPINENYNLRKNPHPLVRLYFLQDSTFRAGTDQPKGQGQRRKEGQLTFHLVNETSKTISETELKTLGQRIKSIFGTENGYLWSKGKESYCYADWDNGYHLRILARTSTQARDLVTKILSLQNHTPDWTCLSKTENEEESQRFPSTPQTQLILGKQVTLPLQRPNVDVRFRFADVRVTPLLNRVVIYDRTGKKAGALVR